MDVDYKITIIGMWVFMKNILLYNTKHNLINTFKSLKKGSFLKI